MCGKGRISACYLPRLSGYLCRDRNSLSKNGLHDIITVTKGAKKPNLYRDSVPKFGVDRAKKVASTIVYSNTVTMSSRNGA